MFTHNKKLLPEEELDSFQLSLNVMRVLADKTMDQKRKSNLLYEEI